MCSPLPRWLSHSCPFLPSFERLLLHAVCQYMDLISASECLLPAAPSSRSPEEAEAGMPEGSPQAVLWCVHRSPEHGPGALGLFNS